MSYREGIIYNLYSPNTDMCYIGCTTKDLNVTFNHLRAYYKRNRNVSSNDIIGAGDPRIEILEVFQDITLPELRKKLGEIQGRYSNICVNAHRAGRTVRERYADDPSKFMAHQRKFYAENRDKVLRKLVLKNMRKRGLPCTNRTREKYKISQEEIDECIAR